MSSNRSLAEQALASVGIGNKAQQCRRLVNGSMTLAPIIAALFIKNLDHKAAELKKILDGINTLQENILRKAVDSHFKLLPANYIAINRLALKLACDSYNRDAEIPDGIVSVVVSLLDNNSIYAECIDSEVSDDEFADQFIAVSLVAAVAVENYVLAYQDELDGTAVAELIENVIEVVDSQLDMIYDDFVEPNQLHLLRNHLVSKASVLLEAVFISERSKNSNSAHRFNLSLITKKFEIAYKMYIEAITMSARMKG